MLGCPNVLFEIITIHDPNLLSPIIIGVFNTIACFSVLCKTVRHPAFDLVLITVPRRLAAFLSLQITTAYSRSALSNTHAQAMAARLGLCHVAWRCIVPILVAHDLVEVCISYEGFWG